MSFIFKATCIIYVSGFAAGEERIATDHRIPGLCISSDQNKLSILVFSVTPTDAVT